MSQATLEERFVIVPAASESRLDQNARAYRLVSSEDHALDQGAPSETPTRLASFGRGVVITLRLIGAMIGIAAAAFAVGIMVAAQRALHLG